MKHESKASHRLVCCSDILGFSPKFKSMPTNQKLEEYNEIIETLKSACHYICDYRTDPSEFSLKRCNFYWFSDTFLLFSNEFSFDRSDEFIEDTLVDFLRSVKSLFLRFLYSGFPLRGGIDYGEFIAEPTENIFIGEALIDTFKNSEGHAWAGIALLPNLSSKIIDSEKIRKLLTRYQVPTKNGSSQEMTVINWASDLSITSKDNPEEYISTQFRKYCMAMEPKAEDYCKNTISFLKQNMITSAKKA
ncbi:MAG: hypothetical protein WC836_18820 [Desulfobacula sp.]